MSVSFYRDVYPLVMGALHNDHVIDESEAREIVALSARVVPEDRQAARNQIQALRNTAATAPAWPVLDEFLRRGSGSTPAPPTGARPAPAPAPRPTPSPMPPPMPPSRPGVATRYPPGVVPFGRTRDVPPWIGQLRLPEILDDFGGGNGFNGTGVHLGRGVVLTAGHVVTGALDMNFPRERIFAGEQPYDFHMGLLFWPEGGTYRGNRYPRLSPASRGEWNDFCIVRNELKRGHQAVPGVRPTGSLRAGERVWVVGDQTGDNIRVSTGRFRGLDGANADIESIDVEEGFSGSPVLDDGGRLVGLAVARWSDGNLYIVRTETIARALAEHAPTSEAAGVMAGALEPIRT